MIQLCVIASGLAIEIGSLMLVKGLQIALPELAKLTDAPEIEHIADSLDPKKIIKAATRTIRNLQIQSS